MPERRHLVVVHSALQTRYLEWLETGGAARSWDLMVCSDPAQPPVAARLPEDVVRIEVAGERWAALARLLRADPAGVGAYRQVWLPDESVRIDGAAIDRMFALMEGMGTQIAQPILDDPSGELILRRNPAFAVRQVNRLDSRAVAIDTRLLPRALALLDGAACADSVVAQQWPGLVRADACVVLDCVAAHAGPAAAKPARSSAVEASGLSPLCWGGIDRAGVASSLFADDGEQFMYRLCEGYAELAEPAALGCLLRSHLQALHEFRVGLSGQVPAVVKPAEMAAAASPATGAGAPPTLTTVFVFTVGDPALPACMAALDEQPLDRFRIQMIENVSPFNAAVQAAIDRCNTPFFIQVDEDMILFKGALERMEAAMRAAPAHVGMVCFHLYDDDLGRTIQGVKIFRRAALQGAVARNVQTSEMDLLSQMKSRGYDWVLDPTVLGRHGVVYTTETIYRRYKSMYEKDIRAWNHVDGVLLRKIAQFAATGDALDLFALLGAWHGVVMAPRVADEEAHNASRYELPELGVLGRLLKTGTSFVYDPAGGATAQASRRNDVAPIPVAALEPQTRRVLIACDHYWPFSGGVESIAADLAQVLIEAGYTLEVATGATAERQSDQHRGVRIHSLDISPGAERHTTNGSYQLRGMIESGRYEVVIGIGAPDSWSFLSLENLDRARAPHTRVVTQFLVNAMGLDLMRKDPALEQRAVAALRGVDARAVLSTKGMTAEFLDRHGLSYQPTANATYALRGDAAGFKARHGLPVGRPVVLHLASLYPEKNHPEFLDVMRAHPELDVTLLLVGRPVGLPHLADYTRQVMLRINADSRCIHVPGIERAEVGDALAAADLLVLPSLTEVSPVCLLEAMSTGLPWIASPNAGNAAELDGGVVCPVAQFPSVIAELLTHPVERRALGAAGQTHWREFHAWEAVRRQWLAITRLKDHRTPTTSDAASALHTVVA